jgi:hypothetical protein
VDPPHKRRGPRTVAAVRGPKSHISIIIFITTCDTRKPPALANVCACSCATTNDDFATASAAGNPIFIIQLTALDDGRACMSAEQDRGGVS